MDVPTAILRRTVTYETRGPGLSQTYFRRHQRRARHRAQAAALETAKAVGRQQPVALLVDELASVGGFAFVDDLKGVAQPPKLATLQLRAGDRPSKAACG
jgi:hypothetical protein